MAFSLKNKHALLLILGVVVAVAAYLWAHWPQAIPMPPLARAPHVTRVASVPGGPQTPEYNRLQRMADETRANRARAMGASAVPTPPQIDPLKPADPAAPPVPPAPVAKSPAVSGAPVAAPPLTDETDRLTDDFARAMQSQTRELVAFRERFEPKPTRMMTFEDIKGQRERAEAERLVDSSYAETRFTRPNDRYGSLQPGDILYAVLQTAINSDEPGPVRAKVVGERFKDAFLLGELNRFPPVVGHRPERVLVKFNALTTPDRRTYRMDAYAIDTETARTALATGVDHHFLERWGSLVAASFLEGYGNAIRANNSITTVGPLGNVISVPKGGIDNEDIALEALGTVGQRMANGVGENFQRPNTITVASGTGIGVLVVTPSAKDQDRDREDERNRAFPVRRSPRARESTTSPGAPSGSDLRSVPIGLPKFDAPTLPLSESSTSSTPTANTE